MAWAQRRQWLQCLRLNSRKRDIDQGRVVCKSKKLLKLKAVKVFGNSCDQELVMDDNASISRHAAEDLGRRWGSGDATRRDSLFALVKDYDGRLPDIHQSDVESAFAKL